MSASPGRVGVTLARPAPQALPSLTFRRPGAPAPVNTEDPSYAEDRGDSGVPDPPRKPDLPRSFPGAGARDRGRITGTPAAPSAPGMARGTGPTTRDRPAGRQPAAAPAPRRTGPPGSTGQALARCSCCSWRAGAESVKSFQCLGHAVDSAGAAFDGVAQPFRRTRAVVSLGHHRRAGAERGELVGPAMLTPVPDVRLTARIRSVKLSSNSG